MITQSRLPSPLAQVINISGRAATLALGLLRQDTEVAIIPFFLIFLPVDFSFENFIQPSAEWAGAPVNANVIITQV